MALSTLWPLPGGRPAGGIVGRARHPRGIRADQRGIRAARWSDLSALRAVARLTGVRRGGRGGAAAPQASRAGPARGSVPATAEHLPCVLLSPVPPIRDGAPAPVRPGLAAAA
ncbi:hypothetical protein GCM10009793_31300 [Brachybacterium phenoliresistens]